MTTEQNIAIAKVKPNWDFWGMIDSKGDYILEPICKTIFDWKDGIARLEKIPSKTDVGGKWTNHYDGQYGFINSNGKLITDFSFGYANDFSNGLAAVNKDQKWGFIDKSGQLAIPFQFDNIHHFQNEGCIALLDGKWGLIDRNGKWKLENEFDNLSDFAFGLAVASIKTDAASNNEHKFIIDASGNKIVDLPKDWQWVKPVSDQLILVGTTSNYPGDRTFGFMNLQGQIITQPQFYTDSDSLFDTGDFKEGMLAVRNKEGSYGFVNDDGALAIPLQFQSVTSFNDGVAKVSLNDKIFYIDKTGKQVDHSEPNEITKPFDEAPIFYEGLAVVKQGDFWGVINENNKIVIDFKFQKRFLRSAGDKGFFFSEYLPKFSCGLIGVCEERDTIYSGYLDKEGKTAIELRFRIAEPFYLNS
jgi:hypothetical protein